MSVLDNTSHDLSHEHHLDPFVERADTGDFPALRADTAHSAAPDTGFEEDRGSTNDTVPAPDNHEEHSTLLIAALLPIGCLWIGITVDSLFDSLALTATSVAVFATLTLGVLVASALHDSE